MCLPQAGPAAEDELRFVLDDLRVPTREKTARQRDHLIDK